MDAKRAVEIAQAESEATHDKPIPEEVRGERRGRPVGALMRGWVLAGLASERSTSLRDAIEHLAAEAERLRRLAAISDVA